LGQAVVKALALGFLSVTLLASGCATIPESRDAAAITPAASLAAERSFAGASVVTDDWPHADWWHAFVDPQLDALIAESLAGSPSLKVARSARARRDR
jgi:outer membrane protein TolC